MSLGFEGGYGSERESGPGPGPRRERGFGRTLGCGLEHELESRRESDRASELECGHRSGLGRGRECERRRRQLAREFEFASSLASESASACIWLYI